MKIPVMLAPGPLLRGLATLHDMEPAGRGPVGLDKKGQEVKAVMVLRDLESLFDDNCNTDGHVVAYCVTKNGEPLERQPRLVKESLPAVRAAGYDVLCFTVWLDLDLKDMLKRPVKVKWADLSRTEADDARTVVRDAIERLAAKGMEPHAIYQTSGGCRFAHALAFPVPAGAGYEALLARFHAAYQLAGLPVDPACRDWTRLYRAPRVTRDGEPTWEQDYYLGSCELDEDTLYIPTEADLVPPPEAKVVELVVTHRERPDPDQARDLVERLTSRGIWTLTEDAKKAKKELEDSAVYPWIFQRAPLAFQGKRHDTLTRAIGEVIGTLHGYPWASPELIYGLLREPAERFGEDEDWAGKVWEMTCSFWARQDQQKAQRAAEIAERVKVAEAVAETEREKFLRGIRTWLPDLEGVSDEEAITKVQEGKFGVLEDARRDLYHILLPSGFYDDHACAAKALPRVIEQRHMDWLVPTQAPRDDGRGNVSYVQMNPLTIIQRSVRTYTAEEIRLDKRGSYLKRDYEGRDIFVSVPFYLREDVKPVCVPTIYDYWLAAAGGDKDRRDEMLRALGYLLLFQYGPTAAVLLWGEGNGGKSLAALGMGDCISTGRLADGDALIDNFNSPLKTSPIVYIEEAANRGTKGIDGAASLRRLITATSLWIEDKGKDKLSMQGVHRVLMTANSLDILVHLVGNKARSRSDWKAVAERIAEFHMDDGATRWFETHNRGWKETRKWIGGFGRTGLYAQFWNWVIRELIEWDGDRPKMLGRRLLYEGNTAGYLMQKLESHAGAVPEVACAINRLLSLNGKIKATLVKGKVYATQQAVVDEVLANNNKLSSTEIRAALDTMLDPDQPEGRLTIRGCQARWKVLDARILMSIIEQHMTLNKIFEELNHEHE